MGYRPGDSGGGPGGAAAGPSKGAPAGPTTPGSSGPAKAGPGERGPTTAGDGAGGARAYVITPRGPSSRTTLKIDWRHPIQVGKADPENTSATPRRHALPAAEALAQIADGDRRPLLVLRECNTCSGTEDALVTATEDNERTYLLARWFRCVKLPPDVLDEDHPFRNLFPGERPPHLFVCNSDGSERHDLTGMHSRSELWEAMEDAIDSSYQGAYSAQLQRLTRLLDGMDEVDRTIADLETRIELALSGGEGASKTKKLQMELEERRLQRDELLAAADRVSRLELKPPPAVAAK